MSATKDQRDPTGFATLYAHRELLAELIKRHLSQEHKGTFVGAAWILVRPLLLLALYVFVFGFVFESRFDDTGDEAPATFALGVFLGLSIIHFLSEIIAASPRSIADNPRMVKKVKMPVELIPAAIAANAAVHFCISLALAMVGLLIFGHPPTWHALWAIPIVLCLGLAGLGIAYLFATIGVHLRDITQINPVLTMGLLFASAVFYPIDKIPPLAWEILRFNPALLAVEGLRQSLLWGQPLHLGAPALYFATLCLALYATGYLCFQKAKPTFADLV